MPWRIVGFLVGFPHTVIPSSPTFPAMRKNQVSCVTAPRTSQSIPYRSTAEGRSFIAPIAGRPIRFTAPGLTNPGCTVRTRRLRVDNAGHLTFPVSPILLLSSGAVRERAGSLLMSDHPADTQSFRPFLIRTPGRFSDYCGFCFSSSSFFAYQSAASFVASRDIPVSPSTGPSRIP